MRSNVRAALVALGLVVGVAASSEAQTNNLHIGPRLSFDFDAEEIGIGAQVGIPVGRRVELYPSFDYFFVDPGTLWSINADVKARIFGERLEWLYTGVGHRAHRARPIRRYRPRREPLRRGGDTARENPPVRRGETSICRP